MFDTRLFYQQILGDRRSRRMPQRITRLGSDRPSQRQQAERR